MRLSFTSNAAMQLRLLAAFLAFVAGSVFAQGAAESADIVNPHAELREAWKFMQLGRWVDAEEKIAALKVSNAGEDSADIACQAHLAEGNLWQFRRPGADMVKAAACYEWVLKNHPHNAQASWALLALARLPDLDVLAPKPADAVPLYRRVIAEYPDSDAAQEAVLHLALALWKTGGLDGARAGVAEVERWRAARPNADYTLHAELLLGKLYRYPLQDYSNAVAHLRIALDTNKGSSFAQRAYTCWTIASLAEHELKDRALAVEYYTRFLREFPNHRTTFMVKQGLARLGAPVPETGDGGLLSLTIDAPSATGTPEKSAP